MLAADEVAERIVAVGLLSAHLSHGNAEDFRPLAFGGPKSFSFNISRSGAADHGITKPKTPEPEFLRRFCR